MIDRDYRLAGAARVIVIVAGLIGFATAAEVAPAPAPVAAAGDEFDNPEAVAERFGTELGRLTKQQEVVTPAALAKQAAQQKTCRIEITADPGKELSPETIYATARRSVVIVGGIAWCKRHEAWHASCATGFVVHKDGVIATNFHVVTTFQEMRAVGVMTSDGRVYPIKAVLAADAHNDLAVLKIEAQGLAPLPVADRVPVGAAVYCLSHPSLNYAGTENAFYSFTQGIVCGKFQLRGEDDKLVNVLAITADYAQGSSGGPILNSHGAVIGIVCQNLPLSSDEEGNDVQMTWKFSRPSSSLLPLLRGGPASPRRY